MHERSAGGVVVNTQGLVVVVSQRGVAWSLPKGHIEQDEDPREAAVREIREESGITRLTYIKDLGSYVRYRMDEHGKEDPTQSKEITLFLYLTDEQILKPIDPKNPEARWVHPDQVPELLTHPKDKDYFRSLLRQIEDLVAKNTR